MNWYDSTPAVFQNPRHLLPAPEAETLPRGALLFATSGSSGQPKWVAHTRSSLLASAAGVNRHLQAAADDVWLRALPDFHVGGLAIHARAELSGSRVAVLQEKWSPTAFVSALRESRATLTALAPTQIHDLAQAEACAPPALRAVIVGGGALDPALYNRGRALGWPLLPSYGLTEAGSQVATAPLQSLLAQDWPDLLLLDHWEARENASGLLEIRGPALFNAYYAQDGAGWARLHPFQRDWFACQDRASLLPGNILRWRGRADRVVKILGELTDLDAIEQRLAALAGGECVVIPLPHPRNGWELAACSEMPLEAALQTYHASCAPFARVAKTVSSAGFPRSPLGKPLRAEWVKLAGV